MQCIAWVALFASKILLRLDCRLLREEGRRGAVKVVGFVEPACVEPDPLAAYVE